MTTRDRGALLLSAADVEELCDVGTALAAVREGFRVEAAGNARLPVRMDVDTPTGFLRMMPAMLGRVMGCKIMTLVQELGTRYIVLVFDVATGACTGVVDAELVTKMRTAATTALAAEHMTARLPRSLSIIGTGFEATGHLEFLATLWPLERVVVFSRSQQNRQSFADAMSAKLGIDVTTAVTSTEALRGASTVLLATKAREPVLDGADLQAGAVVLSIGSTRPDLRELDVTTLRRSRCLVVDSVEQVRNDSGDLLAVDEAGVEIPQVVSLASLVSDGRSIARASSVGEKDITVFKSAGTALQDLALASALLDLAGTRGVGATIGEPCRLKPFLADRAAS